MGERLHQIVVGAEIEPLHAVGQAVAGRQHDDGRRVAPPSHRANDLEPVAVGQTKIEQDDLVLCRLHRGARVLDEPDDIHGEPALAQVRGDQIGELGLILDEKYSHGSKPDTCNQARLD